MARAARDADRTSAIVTLRLLGLILLTRRLLTDWHPETGDSGRPNNRAWILGHVRLSLSLRPGGLDEVGGNGHSLPVSISSS